MQRPVEREDGPRVGHRGLDLGPVADDAGVAEQPLDVRGPNSATTSGSKPANAARNASRLRRIVSHDRPDWKASRLTRSYSRVPVVTGRPHSVSW